MKKVCVLLFCFVLLVTGCSVVKLEGNDLDHIIDKILSHNSKLSNVRFDGYSYYVPKGFQFVNRDKYNALLRDKHNNLYYVYVDVMSYYHSIEKEYKVDKDAYFSRILKNGEKFGYVEINAYKDKYFIEAMYNYVKIEAYVREEHITDSITGVMTILNSVVFNRTILESTIGDNVLDYKEETFDIFETKKRGNNSENFLRYVEEFDRFDDKNNELPDEDNLRID